MKFVTAFIDLYYFLVITFGSAYSEFVATVRENRAQLEKGTILDPEVQKQVRKNKPYLLQ